MVKKTAPNSGAKTKQLPALKQSGERVSAEDFPRRSLEESVPIAKILKDVYAGGNATWEEIAKALGVNASYPTNKYPLWAATAYGIVNAEGAKGGERRYSLSEIGRKIVAETYEGEAQEGKIKALLTPVILSKFLTEYNGHQIPAAQFFPNVLESRYKIPKDRTQEAIRIIAENGKYAGIFEDRGEGQQPVIHLKGIPVNEAPNTEGAEPREPHRPPTGLVWEKICFYITPLGNDNSEERQHANMLLKHVVKPVLSETGMEVVRADDIAKSGIITQQILEHLAKAKLCIADLSFHNPNAFYELGVRHAFMLPTIQIIHKVAAIPFDVSQGRTIVIDTSDRYAITDRLESAKRELQGYVKNLLAEKPGTGGEDNPVAVYLPGIKVSVPK